MPLYVRAWLLKVQISAHSVLACSLASWLLTHSCHSTAAQPHHVLFSRAAMRQRCPVLLLAELLADLSRQQLTTAGLVLPATPVAAGLSCQTTQLQLTSLLSGQQEQQGLALWLLALAILGLLAAQLVHQRRSSSSSSSSSSAPCDLFRVAASAASKRH
jgi:hypothetical protein